MYYINYIEVLRGLKKRKNIKKYSLWCIDVLLKLKEIDSRQKTIILENIAGTNMYFDGGAKFIKKHTFYKFKLIKNLKEFVKYDPYYKNSETEDIISKGENYSIERYVKAVKRLEYVLNCSFHIL